MSIQFYNFWSNDAAINKFFYYTHCGDAILAVNDKSTRQHNKLYRVLFLEVKQSEQENRRHGRGRRSGTGREQESRGESEGSYEGYGGRFLTGGEGVE